MIAHLELLEGIGKFKLGSNIHVYEMDFDFEYSPPDPVTGSESYSIDIPYITIFTYDKVIESIVCYEECLFQGKNLIGITLQELLSFTSWQYDKDDVDEMFFEEDGIPQIVYIFDAQGLQVWTKKNVIVAIIVSSYIAEDE